MRTHTALQGTLVLLALASCCACFSLRGPADVHEALDRKLGVHLHEEFGFRSGFLTTKLAGGILRAASDEPVSLEGLSGFEIGVYSQTEHDARNSPGIDRFTLDGWDVVLRARDKEGEALFLVRRNGDSIREVLLLVRDQDEREIVVARLRGHLEQLLEQTVRAASRGKGRAAVARDVALVRSED